MMTSMPLKSDAGNNGAACMVHKLENDMCKSDTTDFILDNVYVIASLYGLA